MAYEFKFPDVGEGITEGTIVKWKVKEGDAVESDQILAEVETDKSVVEIPSPKKGTILKISHKEGETINVGDVLTVIGEAGEKVPDTKAQAAPEKKSGKEGERYTGSVVGFLEEAPEDGGKAELQSKPPVTKGAKIIAAPIARKVAKEFKVDLATVHGTGPGGRITEQDVRSAAAGGKPAAPKKPLKRRKYDFFGYIDHAPMKGIRKITSEKMMQSVSEGAFVTHHDHVDVTELANLRNEKKEEAKQQGAHLTFLPYIILATVEGIKKHPYVASSIEDDDIIIKKYYNIGVAIDTPNGLIVPVIKGVDEKNLYDLAKEIMGLVEKAKTRKIDVMDMKGGVFTITNIGVIGSTYFTPIPNHPEKCILGTGRIEDKPWIVDGKVEIRKMMPISFTYDHRVIDGAEAARFMNDVRAILENPREFWK